MENSYHDNKNGMYQYGAQHHYPPQLYPQCPSTVEHCKLHTLTNAGPDLKFTSYVPHNNILEDHLQLNEPAKSLETEQSEPKEDKKKRAPRKPRAEKKDGDNKKKEKSVDTSTFTIEERLVAAVWIHERHHTHHTITEIKAKFVDRFNREPPSKTTLFAWERKLFATGNVCDAPRPGRPEKRKSHMSEVAESLARSPALSLRARAQALRLPRTTLHNIMKKDLPHDAADKGRPTDKPPPKRRVKQPPRKSPAGCSAPGPGALHPAPAPPPALAAPGAPPPHPHMHYVMHAMHSHAHNHAYS